MTWRRKGQVIETTKTCQVFKTWQVYSQFQIKDDLKAAKTSQRREELE